MVDLPQPIPSRIMRLPRDARGFPVPWFVAWLDERGTLVAPGNGTPDFRVMDGQKCAIALRQPRCWICGELMGRHRVFTIGPMCAINRVISEPPSHRECAEWAVKACPFLSKPRMRRNEKDLPEAGEPAPGIHLDRNPGVVCLWETRNYKPFRPRVGAPGVLFRLGDPDRVDWYSEGRAATRLEVLQAITSGLPALAAVAEQGGPDEMDALAEAKERVMPYLPKGDGDHGNC